MKLSDLRYDSWASIASQIRKGEHPEIAHIVTAFRRQEEKIPAEAQLYIAQLLCRDGSLDRRGAPKKSKLQKTFAEEALVRLVVRWQRVFRDRYRVSAPQERAFEKVAQKHGWKDSSVAARKYWLARKSIKSEPGGRSTLNYIDSLLMTRHYPDNK